MYDMILEPWSCCLNQVSITKWLTDVVIGNILGIGNVAAWRAWTLVSYRKQEGRSITRTNPKKSEYGEHVEYQL